MKKKTLIATLIIGTMLTGGIALASPYGFGGGDCNGKEKGSMTYEQHEERMEHRLEMMSTVLDLTEDQEKQLEKLFDQQWKNKQQQREEMQSSREALREARHAEVFDEADFRTKAAKQAELKTEMMVDHQKMKQQLYSILTPEQQEKADKLRDMMGGRGQGRHGGGGHHF